MRSLGKRASSVQLRVGAPVCWPSARTAVEPALRQVSYARRAQGSTGDCDHFSSWQQPAGFFCKEVVPGQHRREAPIHFAPVTQLPECSPPKAEAVGESPARSANFRASGSAGIADPTDRESVSLGGASPLSPTSFQEPKPQQTGTGLLIRFGEVATTSGSTSLPGRLTAGHRPLKASVVVRIHPRQPIIAR
jgi:hypothetical protein